MQVNTDFSEKSLDEITAWAQSLSSLEDSAFTTISTNIENARNNIEYKRDIEEKLPQIYITTDKGDRESYGTSLEKPIGYVNARIAILNTNGALIVDDTLSHNALVLDLDYAVSGGKKASIISVDTDRSSVTLSGYVTVEGERFKISRISPNVMGCNKGEKTVSF